MTDSSTGPTPRFTLFDTALGSCGVAWTAAGLCAVAMPDGEAGQLRHRFAQRYGASAETAPPPGVQHAIREIVTLLSGPADGRPAPDLTDIELDPSGVPPFNQRVYALTRGIPPGETRSYGDLAARLGQPGAARAVGRALGDNPYPIVVPCHRVLAADGSMHGFSAPGGVQTKRRMLQLEGAVPPDQPTLF
jgi:methylated-DNA-[protein]-cysteine S-methyltransferase